MLSTVAEAWAFQQCSALTGQAMGRVLLHSVALARTASLMGVAVLPNAWIAAKVTHSQCGTSTFPTMLYIAVFLEGPS